MEAEIINQFIIQTTLIDPVSKIIEQLKSGQLGDRDIKWLDAKIEEFTILACKALYMDVVAPSQAIRENLPFLNEFTKNKYLERFGTLLNCFKSF